MNSPWRLTAATLVAGSLLSCDRARIEPLASAPPEMARPARQVARTARPGPRSEGGTANTEHSAPKPSAADARNAEPGYLTLDSSPWSVVSVNGRVLGTTPLVRVALPAGDVLLSLSNPDTGARASYSVRIESGKTVSRRLGLE